MRGLRERLTYANVIATLALFLALGAGGAFALDKIGSKRIKRNAVKSKHIAPDAAGGGDVLESSLGIVPNADRLDGRSLDDVVHRIAFDRTDVVSTGNVALATLAGVRLSANCLDDAMGATSFTVLGEDVSAGGTPVWEALYTTSNSGPANFFEDVGIFNPSDQVFFLNDLDPRNGAIWLLYRESSRTVTVQMHYQFSNTGMGTANCALTGVATVAG